MLPIDTDIEIGRTEEDAYLEMIAGREARIAELEAMVVVLRKDHQWVPDCDKFSWGINMVCSGCGCLHPEHPSYTAGGAPTEIARESCADDCPWLKSGELLKG